MESEPSKPEDWECCESACTPCVWDTYYEELRAWKAAQKDAEKAKLSSEEKSKS